jgi:hypothetical protein
MGQAWFKIEVLLAPSFDWMLAGLGARTRRSDVRVGSMLSKKGFCGGLRAFKIKSQCAILIQKSAFHILIPQFLRGDFFDSIGQNAKNSHWAYVARLLPDSDRKADIPIMSCGRAPAIRGTVIMERARQRVAMRGHCDGHHEMSDLGADGKRAHSGAESVAPVWHHQRLDGRRRFDGEKKHG